ANGSVVIRNQFHLVPRERIEVTQFGGESGGGGGVRQRGSHGAQLRPGGWDVLRRTFLLLDPVAWQINAPKQRVKQQSGPGKEEDQQQPGAGSRRTTPLRNIEQHHHSD